MEYFITIFFSYLSGSVPFGLILASLFTSKDIRKIGSGNIGATNVLRTGNKFLAFVTLSLDALKGFVPVAITLKLFPEFIYLSALLAFLGHIFPIWIRFKGGKGVATYLGILFSLSLQLGFLFILSTLILLVIIIEIYTLLLLHQIPHLRQRKPEYLLLHRRLHLY